MRDAIDVLKRLGAVVVDPADIPSVATLDPDKSFLKWSVCGGAGDVKGKDAGCSVVFKYGMKRDFNAWLASLGPSAPVKTLAELRAFNLAHASRNAIKYGQSLLDISDEMDVDADRARYDADRKKDLELAGAQGIDAVMDAQKLDALVFPGGSGAGIAARPGLPDGDRAVRLRAERAEAAVSARLRREAVALRRQLHRPRVQRAASHRDRVRVRAGHEETRPAAARALKSKESTDFTDSHRFEYLLHRWCTNRRTEESVEIGGICRIQVLASLRSQRRYRVDARRLAGGEIRRAE